MYSSYCMYFSPPPTTPRGALFGWRAGGQTTQPIFLLHDTLCDAFSSNSRYPYQIQHRVTRHSNWNLCAPPLFSLPWEELPPGYNAMHSKFLIVAFLSRSTGCSKGPAFLI